MTGDRSLFSSYGPCSNDSTILVLGGVVQKGNNSLAIHVTRPSQTSWIVDSSSFDHTTGDRSLFSSYSPCSNDFIVRIVDASCSKVVCSGIVSLSNSDSEIYPICAKP